MKQKQKQKLLIMIRTKTGGESETVEGEMGGETSEPEVKTVDNLEDALKNLVNRDGWENTYVEIPKTECKANYRK